LRIAGIGRVSGMKANSVRDTDRIAKDSTMNTVAKSHASRETPQLCAATQFRVRGERSQCRRSSPMAEMQQCRELEPGTGIDRRAGS
jgi:hypothetical protein